MPFRLCSGSERIIFGKHSVCPRSILAVRLRTDAYGTAFGSSKKCVVHVQINFHRPSGRFQYPTESVRKACGKSSVSSMSIRRVLKAYGKHTGSIREAFGEETFRSQHASHYIIIYEFYKNNQGSTSTCINCFLNIFINRALLLEQCFL